MVTINTNDIRVKNAKNLIYSLTQPEGEANAFVFIGRVEQWPTDNQPPTPTNNYQEFYRLYENIYSMRRVVEGSLFHMIPRDSWFSGDVFDYYRPDYSKFNKSTTGAINLYDCHWITKNIENNVYICLNNNGGAISTVEPLNTSNEPFNTADGYQWQRVFNYTASVYGKYKTNTLMPIELNDVVTTVDGSISTVIIENPGGGFTNNPIGAPNQVPFYYCSIDGDGSGAVAKVTVENERVTEVEVVRAGSGYTFATLNFTPNNAYESLPDFDLERDPLNAGGDDTLRTTVIIPPPGGWGADLVRELGGTKVGIFSSLAYAPALFIDASFRQIGILQDVEIDSKNPDTVQSCYGVVVSLLPTGESYYMGEEISQEVVIDGETHNAKGFVIGYNKNTGELRYIQTQTNSDVDGNLYRFAGSNNIVGLSSGHSETPQVEINETLNGIPYVDGYSFPEVTLYSGILTYLANISPVIRDPDQSELISLIIGF